jgi:hypothetical protein
MIQAKDLRVGNIITSLEHDRIFVVSYHEIRYAAINQYNPYIGIALTAKILEQCGFEHKSSNEHVKGNLVFRRQQNDLILNGFENDYNGVILNRPEFLHQLQNLYYSLTDEELPISSLKDQH